MWHHPLEAETLPVAGTNLAKSLVAHKKSKSDGIYHEMLLQDAVPNTKRCPPYVLQGSCTCSVHVVWTPHASLVRQSLVPQSLPLATQSLVPQSLLPQ